MKIKRFNQLNEDIKHKNIGETIDEILDNLSKKKRLSESEKEFMEEASNNTIKDVTVPSFSGDFWSDMSNPHNSGTLWIGKDNVWKKLKDVEEEEDETKPQYYYDTFGEGLSRLMSRDFRSEYADRFPLNRLNVFKPME